MTHSPVEQGLLVAVFPQPGPLLRHAFHQLWIAENGTDEEAQRLGDTRLLPRPWDPPTCTDPELRNQLWAWLDQVVIWFNHEYTWDPNGLIPDCWPLHPHLVHEIAVLADQRRIAGEELNSSALEEWHRYTGPAFVDRMKTRLRAHCDEGHQACPSGGRARVVGLALASGTEEVAAGK